MLEQWVAMFYSIVINPSRRMNSADLMNIAREACLEEPRTALSTGNLIVWASGEEGEVEERLEEAAEVVVGRRIPVLCRSVTDFHQLVASNPFHLETPRHAQEIAIRVMRSTPSPDVMERLLSKKESGDHLHLYERTLWLSASKPLIKSRMMRAINASWVGVGTTRSLSSLRKIQAAI